jgi:hypothetical protein
MFDLLLHCYFIIIDDSSIYFNVKKKRESYNNDRGFK